MRLEPVIIGGVADRAGLRRQCGEFGQVLVAVRQQRLLDQRVLAVAEQIGQQLDLGLVGHAEQRRVVAVERHVLDAAEAGIGQNRIHGGDDFRPSDRGPLATLNAQNRQRQRAFRSPRSIRRSAARPAITCHTQWMSAQNRDALDGIDLLAHRVQRHRDVAIMLAFDACGHRTQDRGDDIVFRSASAPATNRPAKRHRRPPRRPRDRRNCRSPQTCADRLPAGSDR